MLKGNDYKEGLEYIKEKKNRITNSEGEALVGSVIERQKGKKPTMPRIPPKADNVDEKNEK
jgi:hypothetical protein